MADIIFCHSVQIIKADRPFNDCGKVKIHNSSLSVAGVKNGLITVIACLTNKTKDVD